MADWYGHARSNYFRVKDLDAFKAKMEQVGLEVVGRRQDDSVEADGRVAVLSTNDDKGGWPSGYYDDDADEDVEVDVVELIAEHLADDEVAVFMECGAEKLRYLTGNATAVNNKGEMRQVWLDQIYPLAAELGTNVTHASY